MKILQKIAILTVLWLFFGMGTYLYWNWSIAEIFGFRITFPQAITLYGLSQCLFHTSIFKINEDMKKELDE